MNPPSHYHIEGTGDEAPEKGPALLGCKYHPDVAAVFSCQLCSAPVCGTCAHREDDGIALCPECNQTAPPKLALVPRAVSVSTPPPIRFPVIPNAHCVQHPHVDATQQCKLCHRYMCPTCDFSLANGSHICPACASAPRSALSGNRKKFVVGSFVAAIWSTVGMSCLVAGAFAGLAEDKSFQMILGFIFLIFILGPAIAGLGLAISAKRPRRASPSSLWIALVWNSILVGSFVLLMIIGQMR